MGNANERSGWLSVGLVVAFSFSWGCASREPIDELLQGVGGALGTDFVCSNALRDSTIAKATPDTKLGASTACHVDGGNAERACLLEFGLAEVPSTAIVVGVDLRLHVYDESPGTFFPVYEVKVPWVQANATWNKYNSTSGWGTPGAKGPADRGSTVMANVSGSPLGMNWTQFNSDGLEIVQSWVADPSVNNGIIIANADVAEKMTFYTLEAGSSVHPPALCVEYYSP